MNGILLTGSNAINLPTTFQLAETLDDALADPPVVVDLTSVPPSTPKQSFKNKTRKNKICIEPSPSNVSVTQNWIISPVDLNTLDWERGDKIIYCANGGEPIGGLVDGRKYFAVVYVPGFTDCGLLQGNKVANCSVAGFRDLRCPTNSAFLSNVAFKNGDPSSCKTNYDINWPGKPPVCTGDLAKYPVCSAFENISLVPAKKKRKQRD